MAQYESSIKMLPLATAEQVYNVLSDLERLRPILDMAASNPMVKEKMKEAGQDESQLEKLKDVAITSDSIAFPVPMIGELKLQIIDREPNKCIKFEAADAPLDANLWIQMLPVSTGGSKIRLTLKADLNPMIKMMVGSKLEKGIESIADALAQLPYHMM